MAEFNLPQTSNGMTTEELSNTVAILRKELQWLLNNLDSLNITSINTNITTVSSSNGKTIIEGSLLKMYDDSGVLRLVMGNDDGTFLFDLYNEAGDITISLDSEGKATFTGTITGSSITSGSTIDVATDCTIGDNLFLNSNSLTEGIYFSETLTSETSITIEDPAGGLRITPSLTIDGDDVITDVDETDTASTHNHGITPGTRLAVDGGGYVTWAASGSHKHALVKV